MKNKGVPVLVCGGSGDTAIARDLTEWGAVPVFGYQQSFCYLCTDHRRAGGRNCHGRIRCRVRPVFLSGRFFYARPGIL